MVSQIHDGTGGAAKCAPSTPGLPPCAASACLRPSSVKWPVARRRARRRRASSIRTMQLPLTCVDAGVWGQLRGDLVVEELHRFLTLVLTSRCTIFSMTRTYSSIKNATRRWLDLSLATSQRSRFLLVVTAVKPELATGSRIARRIRIAAIAHVDVVVREVNRHIAI